MRSGGYSLQRAGFSLCQLLLLQSTHSRHTGLQQLQRADLVAAGLGLSYSEACGIFLDHDLSVNMVSASMLCVNLLCFLFFGHEACGILVP